MTTASNKAISESDAMSASLHPIADFLKEH